ncbi:MAG: hypothetical protein AABW85_00970 [archaeon]
MESRILTVSLVFISLIIVSSFAFAAPPGQGLTIDVNINVPYNDINYISNNRNTIVTIDFNYHDTNLATGFNVTGYSLDANIYFSTTSGADQNVIVTNQSLITGTDSNRSNWGAPDVNRYVWKWDTSKYTILDGNYFIDVNVFNNHWKNDQNTYGRDSNSSGKSFMIDRTNPTASISSSSTSTDNKYTFAYSGTDATAGVKKYWISVDNSNWTDVNTTTSYTFTNESYPATQTYYVKSQDYADNNSTVASVTVSFSTPPKTGYDPVCGDDICNGSETSATCPKDCSSVCGDGSCTRSENKNTCPRDCGSTAVCGNGFCEEGENPGLCREDCLPQGQIIKQIILSREKEGKPTSQQIRDILTAAGASPNAIEKASAAVGKTNSKRKVEVVKETSQGSQDIFYTNITVNVTNTAGQILRDIKVVESIPKSIASSASKISAIGTYSFRVLVDDPIIEFTVPQLQQGQSVDLTYTVNAQATDSAINQYGLPIAISAADEQPQVTCADISCIDNNPCTTDSCSGGQCSFTPLADTSSCGFGKECRGGQCVQAAASVPGQSNASNKGNADPTLLVVLVVLVVIVAGYVYYNKKK